MKSWISGGVLVGLTFLAGGCSSGEDISGVGTESSVDTPGPSVVSRPKGVSNFGRRPRMTHGQGGTAGAGTGGSGGSAGSVLGGSGGSAGADTGGSGGSAGILGLSMTGATSSTVTIAWDGSQPATQIRVYLAPEPAAVADGPMPDQTLVATLDASAGSHTLTGLCAAVDVFVRVERDTQGGTLRQDIHARTTGGPRATLDNPVREAHGFGPRALQIVLANGDGGSWQSGAWSIHRANGASLPISGVNRHSIPVGAPDYSVGYGLPYSDTVLDVDHRIYLQLGEDLGSHDLLHVQGPGGVDVTLPFSDRYLETPVLQVNQVGYNPRATERWAYLSGWMGDGGFVQLGAFPSTAEVLVESSDAALPRPSVISNLPITLRAALDQDSGGEVRQIDLSTLPASEGARYRIRVPGVGVSWPTAVSEKAAFKAFYVVSRGVFHNRWGADIGAGQSNWTRPADHQSIFTGEIQDAEEYYTESQPKTGARTLIGGYHDAGDYDQRPMHTVVAELLMRAYELHPDSFADNQQTIPESGNGIPDILDEALWGVAGWEQLQESDGGVRQGAQSWRHPWGFYHANTDPLDYYTLARSADVTARASGLFAQASRLVAPFNPTRAQGLHSRAVQAWGYATANGANAPYRLYAAGELFRLTADPNYDTAFQQAWSQIGAYGAFSSFASEELYMGDYMGGGRAVADYLLGYVMSAGASPSLVSITRTQLKSMADEVVTTIHSERAHRTPRPLNRPSDWGGATTTAKYMDTVVAMLQLGGNTPAETQAYHNALSLAADWVLGGNPNGYVYFTGLGSRHVEEVLHLDSLSYAKEGKGSIPGIPVYGPNDDAPNAEYAAPTVGAFFPAFSAQPPGMRYGDVRTLVTCNEFTVWESQAPHTELFAALLGPKMEPPPSWLPGQSESRSPLP
ncbi:MAG: glycoside hydrolase family 9 protein [Deltaproteobacteria bacterium]|nr:glycoside hydrolase family 9 protein [Deltaproteobacteria bacterium]